MRRPADSWFYIVISGVFYSRHYIRTLTNLKDFVSGSHNYSMAWSDMAAADQSMAAADRLYMFRPTV